MKEKIAMKSSMVLLLVIVSLGFIAVAYQHGVGQERTSAAEGTKSNSNANDPTFQITQLAMPTYSVQYRFNQRTGETWENTNATNVWTKVTESEPVPSGDYQVHLCGPYSIQDDSFYTTVRIDRNTGNTWYVKSGKWFAYQEPADAK